MDKSKSGNAAVPEGKMSLVEHARCAAEFCFLWYIANSCNNASYGLTTVSSATILASLSGPFTLLIASRFGADQFTYVKLVAILVCFGGVCLVGLSDSSSSTDTHSSKSLITGDILSIVGAVFYACYITQMKLRIKHESRVDFPLFFGFLGLINMVCLIPVLAVLHYTGVEVFELPGANAIPYMIGNALFGTVLSDYFWMMATLLAGPIVTTLGLSLTTPVAMVGDLVLKGITYSPMYVGGAALIVVGFIGINLPVLANKPAPPPAPTPADVDDS
ncbi:hypothetical protein BCR44DRAFT_59995 [Catenaria anguillulae PL171]|uniref:EamA domain-containing protein n=1 Tax=Catenaria anguillulae PL171 TaxID=765915 RepID=A0A1Y2HUH5_9FUNG|nr:hypothetical protein BCR44DRAFT_59995 [Catenaria anguillulae PL171]